MSTGLVMKATWDMPRTKTTKATERRSSLRGSRWLRVGIPCSLGVRLGMHWPQLVYIMCFIVVVHGSRGPTCIVGVFWAICITVGWVAYAAHHLGTDATRTTSM
jgi:hypothetical protein